MEDENSFESSESDISNNNSDLIPNMIKSDTNKSPSTNIILNSKRSMNSDGNSDISQDSFKSSPTSTDSISSSNITEVSSGSKNQLKQLIMKNPCLVVNSESFYNTNPFQETLESENFPLKNFHMYDPVISSMSSNLVQNDRTNFMIETDELSSRKTKDLVSENFSTKLPLELKHPIVSSNEDECCSSSKSTIKLSFGIDQILSKNKNEDSLIIDPKTGFEADESNPQQNHHDPDHLYDLKDQFHFHQSKHVHHLNAHCNECNFLTRIHHKYPTIPSTSQQHHITQGLHQFGSTIPSSLPINCSLPWSSMSQLFDASNPTRILLPAPGYGSSTLLSSYSQNPSNPYSGLPSIVTNPNANNNGRRKRSWSRAVFSNLQRKGLEKRFQIQKYITKPDRRQLAATLGLTDAQVKVWFQNRRMKWRHTKEGKGIEQSNPNIICLNSTKASTSSASNNSLIKKD